jgi:preprotein translocase subunit SecF
MIEIIRRRYYFFLLSLLLIVPGLILLAVMVSNKSLPLSIDFTGGSLVEVRFPEGKNPQPADLIQFFDSLGVQDAKAQTTGEGSFIIRSSVLTEDVRAKLQSELQKQFSTEVNILRLESVGPTIGREVTNRAAQAVAVAALIVVIYMTFAFRGIPHALRYGVCAIIAMAHDIGLVLSLTAIGSVFWGWHIDSMFLTALLTVIGFSVQDKIVVFDRIRENTGILRKIPFETLVNHSIVQTLGRSLNTQLMTVEFMLLALALFGGITLREFAVILLVGLMSGTYSSIFIAAPILVVWEKQEWKTWFKGKKAEASAS